MRQVLLSPFVPPSVLSSLSPFHQAFVEVLPGAGDAGTDTGFPCRLWEELVNAWRRLGLEASGGPP